METTDGGRQREIICAISANLLLRSNRRVKIAKSATKSEILSNIAEATQLSLKQVASVFDALSSQIEAAVGKKGPGVFTLPGLMKIMVIHKPATPTAAAASTAGRPISRL
jgi:hypothetical protein